MSQITRHSQKREAITLDELSKLYGVSPKTMRKRLRDDDNLMIELEENGWEMGNRLWPKHQKIISKHLDEPLYTHKNPE